MKRFKHSLTHYRIMSTNMGPLVPIACYDVLPGDTVQGHSSALIRVSPQVAPVMHPVRVRIHHWFVPNRLVWDGWEDFITGVDDTPPPTEQVLASSPGNLADYMGASTVGTGAANITVNAMPFYAYNLIFNEFYRDQDLVAEVPLNSLALQNIAWEKDYFTTARPWPQKGGDVTVPLHGVVDAERRLQAGGATYQGTVNSDVLIGSSPRRFRNDESGTPSGDWFLRSDFDAGGTANVAIDELREAFALQRYEEARARYGSRYTEYLRYLGVVPADSRLQRPEYIGGGKQTISFSEVLQTSNDGVNGAVGDLAGHGIAALRSSRFRKFIPEHGYIISLMSVIPKTVYMQGLPRHFYKTTKEDYWQRELEHIGQQEVFTGEIYAVDDSAGTNLNPWGYQDRYSEYRQINSSVHGEFKDTLNYWHMARDFSAQPVLNTSFIQSNPTDRIYADQTPSDKLWCMVHNKIAARRMVTKNAGGFVR